MSSVSQGQLRPYCFFLMCVRACVRMCVCVRQRLKVCVMRWESVCGFLYLNKQRFRSSYSFPVNI